MRGLAITVLFLIATALLEASVPIRSSALLRASEKIAALATGLMTDEEREEADRLAEEQP